MHGCMHASIHPFGERDGNQIKWADGPTEDSDECVCRWLWCRMGWVGLIEAFERSLAVGHLEFLRLSVPKMDYYRDAARNAARQ